MSEDVNLLRVLRNRKDYSSSINDLALDSYDAYTRYLLTWYRHYFKTYSEVQDLNVGDLLSLIKIKTPSMTKEQAVKLDKVCANIDKPLDPIVRKVTLDGLSERAYAKRLEALVNDYMDEQEVDLIHEIHMLTTREREKHVGTDAPSWCDTDIDELIRLNADASGYMLDFLPLPFSSQLKGIREGNNICTAADTDKGKTGQLCMAAASFAKQRPKMFKAYQEMINDPDWVEPKGFRPMKEFRPVLYLVNEGTAEQITPRIYQTVLEINQGELAKLSAKGKGKVKEAYSKALNGRADAIRLKNIHGWTLSEVLKEIEKHDPFLVITDMTARISYGGSKSDIDKVEAVWNDLRAAAAPDAYNFIHWGTSQLSAEGKNMPYPPLSALQNSKTGIQTTLDLALWIGSLENPIDDLDRDVRFVSTPKNKLVRVGAKSYQSIQMDYNSEFNRYE